MYRTVQRLPPRLVNELLDDCGRPGTRIKATGFRTGFAHLGQPRQLFCVKGALAARCLTSFQRSNPTASKSLLPTKDSAVLDANDVSCLVPATGVPTNKEQRPKSPVKRQVIA